MFDGCDLIRSLKLDFSAVCKSLSGLPVEINRATVGRWRREILTERLFLTAATKWFDAHTAAALSTKISLQVWLKHCERDHLSSLSAQKTMLGSKDLLLYLITGWRHLHCIVMLLGVTSTKSQRHQWQTACRPGHQKKINTKIQFS